MVTGRNCMEESNSTKNNTLKLSIQVRLNGLSFCILETATNKIEFYKRVSFEKDHNPVKVLREIEKIYDEEKALAQSFEEVSVLFSNELYSTVPREFFVEEEASNLLKFNTKILQTDVVEHDSINEEMANVYIPYTNITNYLFDKYGEFEFKHTATILIQELLELSAFEETSVYLNNYNEYYDLVIIRNKKLVFCNTFNYDTPQDLIYYLLFTAEQLHLDPLELKLILLGDIDKDSAEYKIMYTYINSIEFLEPRFKLENEYAKKDFQRKEFLLLKQLGCE
ncbi:DUF3822 family protein [soil metagenome]